jgi:2'-5' RNA ligase
MFDDESKIYCCSIFDTITNNKLKQYCKKNNIPNIPSDFHATIVYSKVHIDFEPMEFVGVTIPSYNTSISKWKTDKSWIVVLTLNSKWLQYRFREAKELGATWDFPEYAPHITLSYDAYDFDIKNIPMIDFDLVIESEYCEY